MEAVWISRPELDIPHWSCSQSAAKYSSIQWPDVHCTLGQPVLTLHITGWKPIIIEASKETVSQRNPHLGAWSLGLSIKIWVSFGVCSKCHFPGEITLKIKHGPRSLIPPFASRSWETYLRISSGLQWHEHGGSAASGCWSLRSWSQAPILPFPCLSFQFESILSVWARQQLLRSLGWSSTSFFNLLSLMPLCLVK